MSHEKKPGVYHERQRLQFCLLHSLNNLFQRKDAFTRQSLNLIAERLVRDDPDGEKWTPLSLLFKPHHNALTGNYDVNVLIAALEGEGKMVAWHDHRSGAAAIGLEDSDDRLMGLVLNVSVRREKWTLLSLLFKPHHNVLTGNYDVNVLIAALEGEGKRVAWHDHRTGAAAIGLEDSDDRLMGLVLNVPVRRYAGLWRSRHWVTVREVEGVWNNLDSDLDVPRAFQNIEEVREFLDHVMANGGEVLLVLNNDH